MATPGNNQNKFNNNKPGAPKVEKKEVTVRDIQKEIKDTLARLSNQGGKSKSSKNRKIKRESFAQRRQEEMAAAELEDKILKLTEFVTVSELASMMSVQPTQVISVCMSLNRSRFIVSSGWRKAYSGRLVVLISIPNPLRK